ncbi:MAG: cation-transporting P-type ATPase, partial [Minisyncoccia bacterium]
MSVIERSSWRVEDIFKELSTSAGGLSEKEVESRRKKYGLNQLSEQKVYWHDVLLRQFKSSFIYLLLGVAVLYYLMEQII